jgi:FkbM family methyltransferase
MNWAYVGNNLVLGKTVNGILMYLDARDISMTPHIMFNGGWERHITEFLSTHIMPNEHIIDIGANIGYHTLVMAMSARKGTVTAYEANPHIAEILRINLNITHGMEHVQLRKVIVSDVDQESVPFYICRTHNGASSIRNLAVKDKSDLHFEDKINCIEVNSVKLDTEYKDKPCTFIKMDAEGAEENILNGASELIARCRPRMLIEWHPSFYSNPCSVLDKMSSLGYSFNIVQLNNGYPKNVNRETLLNTSHCEIFLS